MTRPPETARNHSMKPRDARIPPTRALLETGADLLARLFQLDRNTATDCARSLALIVGEELGGHEVYFPRKGFAATGAAAALPLLLCDAGRRVLTGMALVMVVPKTGRMVPGDVLPTPAVPIPSTKTGATLAQIDAAMIELGMRVSACLAGTSVFWPACHSLALEMRNRHIWNEWRCDGWRTNAYELARLHLMTVRAIQDVMAGKRSEHGGNMAPSHRHRYGKQRRLGLHQNHENASCLQSRGRLEVNGQSRKRLEVPEQIETGQHHDPA